MCVCVFTARFWKGIHCDDCVGQVRSALELRLFNEERSDNNNEALSRRFPWEGDSSRRGWRVGKGKKDKGLYRVTRPGDRTGDRKHHGNVCSNFYNLSGEKTR